MCIRAPHQERGTPPAGTRPAIVRGLPYRLRHVFETCTANAGIPPRVIDAWLGRRSDRSTAAAYARLRDEESRAFVRRVPFGSGEPAADAGTAEAQS